ncbi:MAG: nuclear transport factor 2 family protein [Pseudomonadota bacterium]
MSSTEFIKRYEAALGTQNWAFVAPLISDGARVVFSDGAVHAGKKAIKAAYERNFAAIKNEEYRIKEVHWLLKTADSAAYMFDFYWTGIIDGRKASGSGRGTAVLVRQAGHWVLAGEQLGPKP